MQKPDQNQGPGDKITKENGFNLALKIARVHETALTPFTNINFGPEGLRPALWTAGLIFVYGAATEDVAMFYFLGVWLVALALQRMKTFASTSRSGWQGHSRYGGYPWLAKMVCPFVKNETSLHLITGLLCIPIGTLLCPISKPLGAFVIAGCGSMLFTLGVHQELMRVRTQRMRDAEIENRMVFEQARR